MTEPTNEELVKRLRNLEIGLRNLKFTEAAKDAGQAASRLEALGSGVVVPNSHDWTEDYSHENGDYQCHCVGCGCMFYGHKRRMQCKQCALAARPK